MTEARYYRPSGHIGTQGPKLMALWGLGGVIVGGAIYGYWMSYMYFLLMLPAPLFYGGIVGCLVGQAARNGKVRNSTFTGVFGAVVGLVALYTGWVFWLLVWSGHDYFSPFSDWSMFSAVAEAARDGVDYEEDFGASGGMLYFLWFIEAVIIVASCGLAAFGMVDASENTFCDACGEWAEEVFLSADLEATGDEDIFRAELEADPLARLVAMAPVEPTVPGSTSRIWIQACPKCTNFFSLDVQIIETSHSKKGNKKTKRTVLIDNLLIDKPIHDALARHFPNARKSAT